MYYTEKTKMSRHNQLVSQIQDNYILPISKKGQITLPQSLLALFGIDKWILPKEEEYDIPEKTDEPGEIPDFGVYFADHYKDGTAVMYVSSLYPYKHYANSHYGNDIYKYITANDEIICRSNISTKNLLVIPKEIRNLLKLEGEDRLGIRIMPNFDRIYELNSIDFRKEQFKYNEKAFSNVVILYNAAKQPFIATSFEIEIDLKNDPRKISDFMYAASSLRSFKGGAAFTNDSGLDSLEMWKWQGRETTNVTTPDEFYDENFYNDGCDNYYYVLCGLSEDNNDIMLFEHTFDYSDYDETKANHHLKIYSTISPARELEVLKEVQTQYWRVRHNKPYDNAYLQPDIKDIECRHELKAPEKIRLYYERDEMSRFESYYCIRPSFNFVCQESIRCCSECHMLEKAYRMLLKVLPKKNKEELKTEVEKVNLFKIDNDVCQECRGITCEAKPSFCESHAVDMIYYYFYKCSIPRDSCSPLKR